MWRLRLLHFMFLFINSNIFCKYAAAIDFYVEKIEYCTIFDRSNSVCRQAKLTDGIFSIGQFNKNRIYIVLNIRVNKTAIDEIGEFESFPIIARIKRNEGSIQKIDIGISQSKWEEAGDYFISELMNQGSFRFVTDFRFRVRSGDSVEFSIVDSKDAFARFDGKPARFAVAFQ